MDHQRIPGSSEYYMMRVSIKVWLNLRCNFSQFSALPRVDASCHITSKIETQTESLADRLPNVRLIPYTPAKETNWHGSAIIERSLSCGHNNRASIPSPSKATQATEPQLIHLAYRPEVRTTTLHPGKKGQLHSKIKKCETREILCRQRKKTRIHSSVQFSHSVVWLNGTLRDPIQCSTSGLPVHKQLL